MSFGDECAQQHSVGRLLAVTDGRQELALLLFELHFISPASPINIIHLNTMHIFSDLLQRKPRVKSPTPKLYTFHPNTNQKAEALTPEVQARLPNSMDTL